MDEQTKKDIDQISGGFGWEDQIDPTQQGPGGWLLPEGEAIFSVSKFEKERSVFGKFGEINVAVVTLLCSPASGESKAKVDIQVKFGLHNDLMWKITEFFTAIGKRKHGDTGKFSPNWLAIEGEVGRCMIKHRTYTATKGKSIGKVMTTNEIDKFLEPEEAAPAAGGELNL